MKTEKSQEISWNGVIIRIHQENETETSRIDSVSRQQKIKVELRGLYKNNARKSHLKKQKIARPAQSDIASGQSSCEAFKIKNRTTMLKNCLSVQNSTVVDGFEPSGMSGFSIIFKCSHDRELKISTTDVRNPSHAK